MEVTYRRNVTGDSNSSPMIRHIYRAIPMAHPMSPKQQIEKERRLRRQIANNNERRRMQSINNGFDQLRQMLPLGEREKFVSKSALLQATIQHISNLYDERERLIDEVRHLRHIIKDRMRTDPEMAAAVDFSEEDSMMEEDNNVQSGELADRCNKTSIIVTSDKRRYSNSVDDALSPAGDLCSPVHHDLPNEGGDGCKKTLHFGLEDRLCCDSWQPSNVSSENARANYRPRFGSSATGRRSTETTVEGRQDSCLSKSGIIDDKAANSDFADPGRSNLEIILTAIQHIERTGHETILSPSNASGAGSVQLTSVDVSNDSTQNAKDEAVSNGSAGRHTVATFVQGSQVTVSQTRTDGGRSQQQQRIPTLLLHRVTPNNTTINVRSVSASNPQSSLPKRVTHQTSNILVLNHPTVTLTGADGGELQYHLAAVTK